MRQFRRRCRKRWPAIGETQFALVNEPTFAGVVIVAVGAVLSTV